MYSLTISDQFSVVHGPLKMCKTNPQSPVEPKTQFPIHVQGCPCLNKTEPCTCTICFG